MSRLAIKDMGYSAVLYGLMNVLYFSPFYMSLWRLTPELRVAPARTTQGQLLTPKTRARFKNSWAEALASRLLIARNATVAQP